MAEWSKEERSKSEVEKVVFVIDKLESDNNWLVEKLTNLEYSNEGSTGLNQSEMMNCLRTLGSES